MQGLEQQITERKLLIDGTVLGALPQLGWNADNA